MDNSAIRTSPQRLLEYADELYAGRAEIANVRQCVDSLRSGAESFETCWRLARAFFFLGQEAGTVAAARRHHSAGVRAGHSTVRHQPDQVEGHFWLGVNLALLAQLEPAIKAVSHARAAKRSLLRATEIDPAYHAAGPLRVLARLQHKLPRLLGGGTAPALKNFELAIISAPNNTVTRIYFADLLLERGEFDRARAELRAVLTAPFDPDWAFEIERDRALATALLK